MGGARDAAQHRPPMPGTPPQRTTGPASAGPSGQTLVWTPSVPVGVKPVLGGGLEKLKNCALLCIKHECINTVTAHKDM